MHSVGNQHEGDLGEKKKPKTKTLKLSCLSSVLGWLVGFCYEPHKMRCHKM